MIFIWLTKLKMKRSASRDPHIPEECKFENQLFGMDNLVVHLKIEEDTTLNEKSSMIFANPVKDDVLSNKIKRGRSLLDKRKGRTKNLSKASATIVVKLTTKY